MGGETHGDTGGDMDDETAELLAAWRHARQVADLPARFTELLQDQFDAPDAETFVAPFDPADTGLTDRMRRIFPVLRSLPDGSLWWHLTGPPDVVPHAEDLGVTFTADLRLVVSAPPAQDFAIDWQYTVTRPDPASPCVVTHVEDLTFADVADYEAWLADWTAEQAAMDEAITRDETGAQSGGGEGDTGGGRRD